MGIFYRLLFFSFFAMQKFVVAVNNYIYENY